MQQPATASVRFLNELTIKSLLYVHYTGCEIRRPPLCLICSLPRSDKAIIRTILKTTIRLCETIVFLKRNQRPSEKIVQTASNQVFGLFHPSHQFIQRTAEFAGDVFGAVAEGTRYGNAPFFGIKQAFFGQNTVDFPVIQAFYRAGVNAD